MKRRVGKDCLACVEEADREQAEVALKPENVTVRAMHDFHNSGVGKHRRQCRTCDSQVTLGCGAASCVTTDQVLPQQRPYMFTECAMALMASLAYGCPGHKMLIHPLTSSARRAWHTGWKQSRAAVSAPRSARRASVSTTKSSDRVEICMRHVKPCGAGK